MGSTDLSRWPPGRDQPRGFGFGVGQEEGFNEDSQWERSGWQVVQKLKEEFKMRHREGS